MTHHEKYRENVLNVVREADKPLATETIRKRSGIKVWETAKAILLELVVEGKIVGLKTGKSWVFSTPETMNAARSKFDPAPSESLHSRSRGNLANKLQGGDF